MPKEEEEANQVHYRGKGRKNIAKVVDAADADDKEEDDFGSDAVTEAIEDFRRKFTQQMHDDVNEIINDLVKDIEDKKKVDLGVKDKIRSYNKVFIPRQSVLTELLRVSHFQTIYNIFVALLIVIILDTVCLDLLENGRVDLEFEILTGSFNHISTTISIWMAMLSVTLLIYPAFNHWASRVNGLAMDITWLVFYLLYMIGFLAIPAYHVFKYELALASSMIVVTEQVRLLMKVHSFVRENAQHVLTYRRSSNNTDNSRVDVSGEDENGCINDKDVENLHQFPGFSSYLYFLFCPSLIYRKEYPRTSKIRWSYVVTNFMQVIGCTMYIYYLYVRFCLPVFRSAGKDLANVKTYLISVFSCVLPATLMFVLAFFAILHSWLNAFAEMLRFADRMFYEDWWNCKSFGSYYRTWNIVVHDWLYAYIYRDAVLLLHGTMKKRKSMLAMLLVFFVSAMFHEYIISVCLGFFYPILFVVFGGFGVVFIPLTQRKDSRGWNIFMWLMLFFGCGLLLCLYCLEWYARSLCPPDSTSNWIYLLLPRSWTCLSWQV